MEIVNRLQWSLDSGTGIGGSTSTCIGVSIGTCTGGSIGTCGGICTSIGSGTSTCIDVGARDVDYHLMADRLVRFRDKIYVSDSSEIKKVNLREFHAK